MLETVPAKAATVSWQVSNTFDRVAVTRSTPARARSHLASRSEASAGSHGGGVRCTSTAPSASQACFSPGRRT